MSRLLIVSVVCEPDTVSTATIATRLAQELHTLGHDVALLSSFPHYNPSPEVRAQARFRGSLLRPIRIGMEDGVRVARCYIPQKPHVVLRRLVDFVVFHALMVVAVLRHFRDREVTIVISPPLTLALVGMLARALGRGHLVYNVQELWPDVPRDLGVVRNPALLRLLGAVEGWIYRSSDRVVAIGPHFARAIVARGSRPADTTVIPNFADNARIVPTDKANPLAREWGVAESPVVLYAGNIGLTQDFDTLLAAAALLAADDVQFVVVGGGAARGPLEARIRDLQPANVTLREFVPLERIAELYGLADVVVVPLKAGHDRTTTPSKIFSAMAARRPIVACTAPDTDLARTIASARAGVVVPPGDAGELAKAVQSLLEDVAGEAWDPSAARAAAERHAPAVIAAEYDGLLRSLVRGPDQAAPGGGAGPPR